MSWIIRFSYFDTPHLTSSFLVVNLPRDAEKRHQSIPRTMWREKLLHSVIAIPLFERTCPLEKKQTWAYLISRAPWKAHMYGALKHHVRPFYCTPNPLD